MKTEYKVVVAHPGKQHSFYLAEALEKENMLDSYVTTVYDGEHSITHFLGKFLKGDNKKRFLTRKNEIFDQRVVQTCEIEGLLYLFLIRVKWGVKIRRHIESELHEKTYLKALEIANKHHTDAIIVFGGYKPLHKEYLEKHCPWVKCIIDVPTLTNPYVVNILERDIERTGDRYIRYEQSASWNEEGMNTIRFWSNNADGYLAGSNVVKKSLEYLGTPEKKIKIVHYGVDTAMFSQKIYPESHEIITFVFVGAVNRRKGIHHLLPAFSKISPRKAKLIIVGKYDETDPLILQYKNKVNIEFAGFVTKDMVPAFYQKADVFVLPSLGEGMAQVGIEAMSSGLPVICTDVSGVNDVIVNGANGFVIPASDEESITNRMEWFIENPDQIEQMGKNARKTALTLTWDDYSQNVCKAVREVIQDK